MSLKYLKSTFLVQFFFECMTLWHPNNPNSHTDYKSPSSFCQWFWWALGIPVLFSKVLNYQFSLSQFMPVPWFPILLPVCHFQSCLIPLVCLLWSSLIKLKPALVSTWLTYFVTIKKSILLQTSSSYKYNYPHPDTPQYPDTTVKMCTGVLTQDKAEVYTCVFISDTSVLL